MTINDVYDHAIDWLWAALAGAFVVVARAIVRLRGVEERVKALEISDKRKDEALADLTKNLEESHLATRNHIDSRVEDIRADLRIIMSRCLAGQKDCQ